jgi:hypothetical protein
VAVAGRRALPRLEGVALDQRARRQRQDGTASQLVRGPRCRGGVMEWNSKGGGGGQARGGQKTEEQDQALFGPLSSFKRCVLMDSA